MRDEQELQMAVYLVIEPDLLLRTDLTETLQYRDSQAVVISEANADAALHQIAVVQTIRLALVAAGPCDFASSRLQQMIAQKGGQVVLMGDRAEAAGEANGFKVLHRPFSETEVLAVLGD